MVTTSDSHFSHFGYNSQEKLRNLRHTHATLLGEVGESLRTAQAILGHSDLETTLNVYTHAIPESQKRAVEKVAELFVPICSQVFSGYRKPEH